MFLESFLSYPRAELNAVVVEGPTKGEAAPLLVLYDAAASGASAISVNENLMLIITYLIGLTLQDELNEQRTNLACELRAKSSRDSRFYRLGTATQNRWSSWTECRCRQVLPLQANRSGKTQPDLTV